MKNLQHIADDVGVIAEAVKELGTLVSRFHQTHGERMFDRLATAWPTAELFGIEAARPLYRLERDLTPPDERCEP